jgi:hypothetical protein
MVPDASSEDLEACTGSCYNRFQCGTKMGYQTLQVDANGDRVDGTVKKRSANVNAKNFAMNRDSSAASKASVTAATVFISAIVALLV